MHVKQSARALTRQSGAPWGVRAAQVARTGQTEHLALALVLALVLSPALHFQV